MASTIPDKWLCGAITYRMKVLSMTPKDALDDAVAWWIEQERLESIAKATMKEAGYDTV